MYRLYLKQNGEQLLLPVTPAEIETRTGNQNKTAYILDFGEMNLAKSRDLRKSALRHCCRDGHTALCRRRAAFGNRNIF